MGGSLPLPSCLHTEALGGGETVECPSFLCPPALLW